MMPFRLCFVFSFSLFLTFTSAEEKSKTIAGRTLNGWAVDLSVKNEIVRLRAIKTIGQFGPEATHVLTKALEDDSNGVRYWAAYHLGRIGPKAKKAQSKLEKLREDKKAPAVAMVAAFALSRLGLLKENLPLLIERLKHPERGMACSAAELLGNVGPAAKAAIPALEATYHRHERGKDGADYHVQGAAQNALRKIQPGWEPNK